MLVTPKFLTQADIDEWAARCREHGFKLGYKPPLVLREGLIVGHLNVDAELKKRNKFEEYPVFYKDEFMIDFYMRGLNDPDINEASRRHQERELAKYRGVPENYEELYHKEAWRPVYERQFKWDTPETRRRTFENYEPLLNSYGVIDTPEQLLELYDFEADPRKFFIKFTEMRKEDQSDWGGWRWHKLGEYLGTQDPQCEYLYDEPVIESVFVFHIYQLIEE